MITTSKSVAMSESGLKAILPYLSKTIAADLLEDSVSTQTTSGGFPTAYYLRIEVEEFYYFPANVNYINQITFAQTNRTK